MHLPSSGDMEVRDPSDGGVVVSLFVTLDPLFSPGGYLPRTLLFELPCWLATGWVWTMWGTGRKSLSKWRVFQVCFFCSLPALALCLWQRFHPSRTTLWSGGSSCTSSALTGLWCYSSLPLSSHTWMTMAFHCHKSVGDIIPSVSH